MVSVSKYSALSPCAPYRYRSRSVTLGHSWPRSVTLGHSRSFSVTRSRRASGRNRWRAPYAPPQAPLSVTSASCAGREARGAAFGHVLRCARSETAILVTC
eukprot:513212-Prorocentrum_minimum.AAC.1